MNHESLSTLPINSSVSKLLTYSSRNSQLPNTQQESVLSYKRAPAPPRPPARIALLSVPSFISPPKFSLSVIEAVLGPQSLKPRRLLKLAEVGHCSLTLSGMMDKLEDGQDGSQQEVQWSYRQAGREERGAIRGEPRQRLELLRVDLHPCTNMMVKFKRTLPS